MLPVLEQVLTGFGAQGTRPAPEPNRPPARRVLLPMTTTTATGGPDTLPN